MSFSLIDELIGQIEIFDALELEAAHDYGVMEQELVNQELRETLKKIIIDEQYHSKMCREIIESLKNRPSA